MELIAFASVDVEEYPREYKWFTEKCEATYVDYDLKEYLYSVDTVLDEYQESLDEIPDYIPVFLNKVKATSENTAYFRFVKF